jgi:hypothetical protein
MARPVERYSSIIPIDEDTVKRSDGQFCYGTKCAVREDFEREGGACVGLDVGLAPCPGELWRERALR